MRREASVADKVLLCSCRIVWFWLGGPSLLFCAVRSPGNGFKSVTNMTSLQETKRTSWVNCNQNTLSIDFTMLSNQIHILKSMCVVMPCIPDVTRIKQHVPQSGVFSDIFGFGLASNSHFGRKWDLPHRSRFQIFKLAGEISYQDDWLWAGNNHFNKLISCPIPTQSA